MKTQTKDLTRLLEDKLVQAQRANARRLSDIEHRLEYVDTVNGVEYINDAKASDANSSWYSIDCMESLVIWIISSSEYEDDYELFYEMDAEKVKALVVLGPNKDAVEAAFKGRIKTIARGEDLMNALNLSRSFAQEGDVVLYSPAFSDFENYVHYKERGQQFRKAVREMQLK